VLLAFKTYERKGCLWRFRRIPVFIAYQRRLYELNVCDDMLIY